MSVWRRHRRFRRESAVEAANLSGTADGVAKLESRTDVVDGMRRALLLLATTTLVLWCSSVALAGQFSAPSPIPASEASWQFAINSHGAAVAVQESGNGLLFYSLGTGSSFEHPWHLAVARGYSLSTGSEGIYVDGAGHVAVGLSYLDANEPLSPEPHASPPCCLDAAVASWQLGEKPGRIQALTPNLRPDVGYERAPELPAVLVRRSTVTALWSVGGNGEFPEQGAAKLREAFGSVGQTLHVQTLATVANGIDEYLLTKTANALPLAAWLDDNGELHVATGTAAGAVKGSRRAQSVRGGTNQENAFGFTTDGIGDIIFWYVRGGSSGHNQLYMRTSRNGGAFSRPQLVAQIRGRMWNVSILAGAERSVLALWEWEDLHKKSYVRAAFGGILRTLVRSATVPLNGSEAAAVGFVGGAEAFVIYRHWIAGEGPGGNSTSSSG